MSKGTVNKVILVGNLGADPEVRSMPSGSYVANLRIATTESWKDRNSGEFQDRTEWHRVVIFGRQAETAQQYLKKGSKVFIEGKIRTNKWTDQNGQDRYTTEIAADNMQMLDARGGAGSTGGGGYQSDYSSAPAYGSPAPAPASAPQSAPPMQDPGYPDDDIPF